MHGYVYLTIQRSTGARYVGQRRGGFDPDYLGSGKRLRRAIAKHGRADFSVSFLKAANDQAYLDELEKSYISETRELYPRELILNIADGGIPTRIDGKPFMTGRRHSEETKRRMSAGRSGALNGMFGVHLVGALNPMFGRHHSEETKRKIGAKGRPGWNKGQRMTDENRAKISAARKALFASGFKQVFSDETRRKISEGRKRYWAAKREGKCA